MDPVQSRENLRPQEGSDILKVQPNRLGQNRVAGVSRRQVDLKVLYVRGDELGSKEPAPLPSPGGRLAKM